MTREETSLPGAAEQVAVRLPLDFTAFHQLYRPVYVRYAERCLRSRADADEAVDDGFEQVLLMWPEILRMASPAAYVWRVMKNRIVDHARARGRRPVVVEAAVFETATLESCADPIAELEGNLRLLAAVSQLSERQREVIVFRHYEGYSCAEIADHLGLTPAGVRSIDRYARRRLREIYQEGEGR
ncbi:RNA polymerase sigma factor [Streptomyces sp. MAR4 CNX-425]|uniref:RNA polymerase sigma factor n=1 Tax=Streptomyces sp. MAR4 CNX-425 TaxID=3406343 RepID=UPI003B4FFAC3